MRKGARHGAALLLIAVGTFAVVDCSAGGTAEQPGSGGVGGSAGTAPIDASGGTGGLIVGDAGPCAPPCSADLRSALACDGSVKQECPASQACSNGACVGDPCAVAGAAKTSYGCDFYALSLVNFPSGACFAAYIANVWPAPVKIKIEYDGQQYDVSKFAHIPSGQGTALTYGAYDNVQGLGPGEVAVLFLSQGPQPFPPPVGVPCPAGITPMLTKDPTVGGTNFGHAIHIETSLPVAAYEIEPYGGGAAARTYATLLLPTTAWDKNYVAVGADATDPFPVIAMLANEDNTNVTISPTVAIKPANGVAGTAAGVPVTYNLNKGQYVQISEGLKELTGSAVLADKPIAFFGGNPCIGIDAPCCCDNAAQQIPPVHALGHEYAAVRYRARAGTPDDQESVPWRIVGAVDGTTLTYEPAAPPAAPATLGFGEIAWFHSATPFLVRSQDAEHPFYMAAYMTGADGGYGGEGDPEFVNVVPTAQYLNSYVFFADPTYSETNLVLVRTKGPNGFQDVTLDCLGVVGGWQPLGPYEYTRVDLVTGDFKNVGNCSNGRHVMSSGMPFGVTVWGWGSPLAASQVTTYVSYAYPAGVGVAQINQTVIPPNPR